MAYTQGLRIGHGGPVRLEQVSVAFSGAVEECDPHGEKEEQYKEGGHHDFVYFLNTPGDPEGHTDQDEHEPQKMPWYAAEVPGKCGKYLCGIFVIDDCAVTESARNFKIQPMITL